MGAQRGRLRFAFHLPITDYSINTIKRCTYGEEYCNRRSGTVFFRCEMQYGAGRWMALTPKTASVPEGFIYNSTTLHVWWSTNQSINQPNSVYSTTISFFFFFCLFFPFSTCFLPFLPPFFFTILLLFLVRLAAISPLRAMGRRTPASWPRQRACGKDYWRPWVWLHFVDVLRVLVSSCACVYVFWQYIYILLYWQILSQPYPNPVLGNTPWLPGLHICACFLALSRFCAWPRLLCRIIAKIYIGQERSTFLVYY